MFKKKYNQLNEMQIGQIIGMALDDGTPFSEIEKKFSLTHGEVIKVMRKSISDRAFRNWRKRSSSSLRNQKKHPKIRVADSF